MTNIALINAYQVEEQLFRAITEDDCEARGVQGVVSSPESYAILAAGCATLILWTFLWPPNPGVGVCTRSMPRQGSNWSAGVASARAE